MDAYYTQGYDRLIPQCHYFHSQGIGVNLALLFSGQHCNAIQKSIPEVFVDTAECFRDGGCRAAIGGGLKDACRLLVMVYKVIFTLQSYPDFSLP